MDSTNSKWFSRMCEIRNDVLHKCGKADFRAKSFCVDVSDNPEAFKHICTLRSRDRTRFVFNKLFSNVPLARYFFNAVNDGAFAQATEVSMSFVTDKSALMAASQLPHLGRLRMDKATIDKDMARCLVLFDRVSYISIKSARVVADDVTPMALEESIAFLRLHGVTVDFTKEQRVTVRRMRQPASVGPDAPKKSSASSSTSIPVSAPVQAPISASVQAPGSAPVQAPVSKPHDTGATMDVDREVEEEDYDSDALSLGDDSDDDEILDEFEDGEC